MKPITIQEIEFASSVLFAGDKTKFYDNIDGKTGERIDVIQNLENIDVNACPGSGKTTALLAKLIILANRMPFEDGRGICVLTHTNVAIDLIKEKLGVRASRLFAYPNFFGTIQRFVDRFLAIPYCAFDKNARINYVDIEYSTSKARNFYFDLKFGVNDKKTLKNTLYRSGTREREWADASTGIKHINAFNFLSRLVFDYEQDRLTDGINGNTFRKASSTSERARHDFQEVVEYKNSMIQEGIISYDDAYSLAFEYLCRFPNIKEAFTERFKYVFVDEMQDTSKHQIDIIEALFKNGGNSIVQYYGDPNQAIFEGEYQKDSGWSPDPNSPTTFILKRSKRFGVPIANVISPIRVIPDVENPIEGENPESNLKPHIILFDKEDNIDKVLDKFGELILGNQLHKIENSRFVATGRVGKEHPNGELSLKSYFSDYKKENSKIKEYYPHLIQYLRKSICDSNQLKQISDCILNGILHTLELHGFKNEHSKRGTTVKLIKRFSKTTLLNFLKYSHEGVYHDLKEKLVLWSNQIDSDSCQFNSVVKNEVETFISNRILPLKDKEIDLMIDFLKIPNDIQELIENSNVENEVSEQIGNNIFYFPYSEDGTKFQLPIELNTIHGEKGETHTATLYLETFYKKFHDSERIKRQLLGNPFNPKGTEINMATKMAYVAMSRPKYLLCFAIKKSHIQDILDNPENKEKLEKIWSVVEL